MASPSRPTPREVIGAYAGVQRAADADILRAVHDAYRDVNRDLRRLQAEGEDTVRIAQLLAIKRRMLEAQAEIYRRTGRAIEARRKEAAARAIQVAGRYDEAAFAALGREGDARALADGLEETELRTLDAVVARAQGSSEPLSSRVYRSRAYSDGVLERRINSALARGLSAEQMAIELRRYINPNTPGGVRYAALRLARTEINNAFHAMSIQAARLKPWVTKMEWHKSGSHVRKDRCDELDGQTFFVDEVPRKPHPQCMCYVTPIVDDDDEAFLDALAGGEFDGFLDEFSARHGLA